VIESTISNTRGSYSYNNCFLSQLEEFKGRLGNAKFSKSGLGTSSWMKPSLSGIGLSNLINKLIGSDNNESPSSIKPMSLASSESQETISKDLQERSSISKSTEIVSMGGKFDDSNGGDTESTSGESQHPLSKSQSISSNLWSLATKKKEKPREHQRSESFSKRLSGLFYPFIRKGGAIQADLGEEVSFVYDKEFGIWHKKGEKPDPKQLEALSAPPPPANFNINPGNNQPMQASPSTSLMSPIGSSNASLCGTPVESTTFVGQGKHRKGQRFP